MKRMPPPPTSYSLTGGTRASNIPWGTSRSRGAAISLIATETNGPRCTGNSSCTLIGAQHKTLKAMATGTKEGGGGGGIHTEGPGCPTLPGAPLGP